MDAIDDLDTRRFDSLAIVDAANAFADLSDEAQGEELGLWEYSGMDDARHPLSSLLREGHNATCVVRDLDGSLQLLWQESSTSDRWSRGPLYREHLMDDQELEELVGDDPDWLVEAEISMPLGELRRLLAGLPSSDQPVVSF